MPDSNANDICTDKCTGIDNDERREIAELFSNLDLTEVFAEYGHLSSEAIIDLILDKRHLIPLKRGTVSKANVKECHRLLLKASLSFLVGLSGWWPRWLGGRILRKMFSSFGARLTGVGAGLLGPADEGDGRPRKQSLKECMDCSVCWETVTLEELCFCDGTTTTIEGTSKSSSSSNIVALSNETHAFCRQCLEQHALAAVEEMPLAKGGLGLKCMVTDCENPIIFQEIQIFISPSMVQKLEERSAELSVVQAELKFMERCRSCNCAVELGASPGVLQVFSCPDCHLQFCRLCDEPWHDDHKDVSCEHFAKLQNRERTLEKRLSEAVVHKCSKCNMAFVKHDGCNKITCRCGATQCYVCRENDITYSHFCRCLHTKPPKFPFKCVKCAKSCLLWQNTASVEKRRMDSIRKAVEEEEKAKAKSVAASTTAGASSTSTNRTTKSGTWKRTLSALSDKKRKNNGTVVK